MCQKCVLDNIEVPDLSLDANGVCQYCNEWVIREKERRIEATNLPWIYDMMRKSGKGKEYDCLLGLSGGVDSSTCLHLLKENDIRPLTWSLDNGYNKPEADQNVMNMVEKLKIPHHKVIIDLDAFKDLQAAFMLGGIKNLEIPTDHVLLAAQHQTAKLYGIKVIVGGGNHATEGIMPPSYGYDARDLTFIKDVCRKNGTNPKVLKRLPTISLFGYLHDRFILKVKTVNLLDYYDYNRDEWIATLEKEYGYKSYGEKHCENTFTEWFQKFYLPNKWRIDKRKPHFSSLINSGQMKRADAVEELKDFPAYPMLGIEKKIMSIPGKSHSVYRNEERIREVLSKIYSSIK